MARSRYRLTLALQEKIVAYVRAGGFAHVAAEAAGLPRAVFARWLERGERPRAPSTYRAFARAIREAEAQARLDAEVKVRGSKPLDWLKAGWNNGGKSGRAAKLEREAAWSELLDLFGRCAEQLAAYPEARAALSAWLASLPEHREK